MSLTILVAYDFNELSTRALEWAVSRTKSLGGQIHVLHVVPIVPEVVPSLAAAVYPTNAQVQVVERELAQAVARAAPGAHTRVIVAESIGDAIVVGAREIAADLIAMGTRARGVIARAWMGSVADYVVRHADSPVVTMRSNAETTASTPNILVGFDFSPMAYGAAVWAAETVRATGGSLTLAHVISIAISGGAELNAPPAPTEEDVAFFQKKLADATAHLGVAATPRVLVGVSVGASLIACAEEIGATHIAIGTHGRAGIKRAMLGSVADYVLRHADCPVTTVRQGTARSAANASPECHTNGFASRVSRNV